jgi:hypothetical protein
MRSLKMMFYLACILFISSYLIPYTVVDPQLAPYEEEFMGHVKKYCREDQYFHPIQKTEEIKDLPWIVVARCKRTLTSMTVTFNRQYWDGNNHDSRASTLFHEYLHCYFSEPHSEDPDNFMYFEETYVPIDKVNKQLDEILQKRCK